MFESSQNVLLKPTESWREALLDSRVMELFFTVSPAPTPAHREATEGCLGKASFYISLK